MAYIKSFCSKCKKIVKENDDFCKSCGNRTKNIYMKLTDSFSLSEQSRSKKRKEVDGKQKVVYEQKTGDDFYHKEKSWSFINRIIDRENNIYIKFIQDKKTKKILWDIKKPLDEHIGHGSAKRKKR